MNQRGYAPIVLILEVFLFAVVVVGLYIYWNSKSHYPILGLNPKVDNSAAIASTSPQAIQSANLYLENKGEISIKDANGNFQVIDKGSSAYLFSDKSKLAYIHDLETEDEPHGRTYSDLIVYDYKLGTKSEFLSHTPNVSMSWSPNEKYVVVSVFVYEYPSGKVIGDVDLSYNALNAFITWIDDDNFLQEEYIESDKFDRCTESGEVSQISKISLPSMKKVVLVPANEDYDFSIESVNGNTLTYKLIPSSNVPTEGGSCTDPKGDIQTKQLIIK